MLAAVLIPIVNDAGSTKVSGTVFTAPTNADREIKITTDAVTDALEITVDNHAVTVPAFTDTMPIVISSNGKIILHANGDIYFVGTNTDGDSVNAMIGTAATNVTILIDSDKVASMAGEVDEMSVSDVTYHVSYSGGYRLPLDADNVVSAYTNDGSVPKIMLTIIPIIVLAGLVIYIARDNISCEE